MDLNKRLLSQLQKAQAELDPVRRERMVEDAVLDFEIRSRTRVKIAQAHADYVAMCRGSSE